MTESLQTISQFASTALISSIWQGAVLSAMIWLCLKFAPRTSAGVRFNIWSAVFAATAALPLLSIVTGHTDALRALPPTHSRVILLDSRWALGIAAFWAILAAGRLIVLARNAFKIRALWKSATQVQMTSALQSILAQPGLRNAALCTSPRIDQPCAIGFFSPQILIPCLAS